MKFRFKISVKSGQILLAELMRITHGQGRADFMQCLKHPVGVFVPCVIGLYAGESFGYGIGCRSFRRVHDRFLGFLQQAVFGPADPVAK